jgi:hypothetical protein
MAKQRQHIHYLQQYQPMISREAPAGASPLHMTLATEALLDGWTREQVITALITRIQRDERYLAYRKTCGRKTSYDDQVQQDVSALALAAVWLEESGAEDATGRRISDAGR